MKNKKLVLFALTLFIGAGIATMNKNHESVVQETCNKSIVNEQGHPTDVLLQLLSLTDIEHDGSLASIVQATQKADSGWMRKEGCERWDIVDTNVANQNDFFDLFHKLHLVDEIVPQQQQYDYVLLMGAAYDRIASRLQYAIQLCKQGVRFDNVVILSGARPLTDAEITALQRDYNFKDSAAVPATEAELMQFVYDTIKKPENMDHIPVVLINAPMKITKNGALARPTTGDTVIEWMKLNPVVGSCLVISNQPYVCYQDSVAKTLLPHDFTVETVGEKSHDVTIGIYLDTLARNLYQEKIRLSL
ncbi:hypothetical protein [Candidatus Chromulinivorax destructor]|uniref:Uncharacterized protein n=1 Tax=Candidatus Chromulinivorax destructor TaxID=2066483 RepID=A0A345ZBN7_9BACT|nr:hypothetical protein [Candidatus Chromulinivorax destructor]AXK60704.1 hypothetical protein C0J27_03030 [Candidatus Chromulinivorax destructor]